MFLLPDNITALSTDLSQNLSCVGPSGLGHCSLASFPKAHSVSQLSLAQKVLFS